jgi:hypothetical protein
MFPRTESLQHPILHFVALAILCALIYLYKGVIDHKEQVTNMEALAKDSMVKRLQATLKIATETTA